MEYKNIHQIAIFDDGVVPNIDVRNRNLKKFSKDYNYTLWTKNDIIELMKKNNDYEVLNAFNKIKSYSFKADLARFYIINKFGGWYSDINNTQLIGFPSTEGIDMIVFREDLKHTYNSWAVVCGYFYSVPNNPILNHAVDTIIYNVKNNFYGKHALYPTGPSMFGRSIACESYYSDIEIKYGDWINLDIGRTFVYNKTKLAIAKKLKPGDVGHSGSNNYVDMWYGSDIYEMGDEKYDS